jgi:hypothetical protein
VNWGYCLNEEVMFACCESIIWHLSDDGIVSEGDVNATKLCNCAPGV